MEPRPLVTIAVSTKEDEAGVEACLQQVLSQDYPEDAIEVIVADGMSMDATRERVLRVAEKDPRVRLIDNPYRTRAGALNAIVAVSRGELIVPMDPGAEYARTHLAKCVDALTSAQADHLAIVPRSSGRTVVERALSAVQSTKLAFAAGGELARGGEPVPMFIGAVRRHVFDLVGLFDPCTRCEEDVELSRRITRAGGTLTVRRDIVVHRAGPASFKDLFQRHYELGRSRARRTIKDRRVASVRELEPFAIVAVAGALAATATVQPLTVLAIVSYAVVTGAAAGAVGRSEGIITIPVAWAAYPVMHLANGVGFGLGLIRLAIRPDWNRSPEPDLEAMPESLV